MNPNKSNAHRKTTRSGSARGSRPRIDHLPSKEKIYANQRFLGITGSVLGETCQVRTISSSIYEGIFSTVGPYGQMVCDLPHKVNETDPTIIESIDDVVAKSIYNAPDIVTMSVKNVDLDFATAKGFAIDSAISNRQNGQMRERDLEPWQGGEAVCKDVLLEDGANGWGANEMFDKNKGLGVRSSYSADMKGYTTPLVKRDSKEYHEKEAEAHRIAGEIQGSQLTHRRAELENGISEEDRFSAVIRTNENPQNSGKYSIPHKRKMFPGSGGNKAPPGPRHNATSPPTVKYAPAYQSQHKMDSHQSAKHQDKEGFDRSSSLKESNAINATSGAPYERPRLIDSKYGHEDKVSEKHHHRYDKYTDRQEHQRFSDRQDFKYNEKYDSRQEKVESKDDLKNDKIKQEIKKELEALKPAEEAKSAEQHDAAKYSERLETKHSHPAKLMEVKEQKYKDNELKHLEPKEQRNRYKEEELAEFKKFGKAFQISEKKPPHPPSTQKYAKPNQSDSSSVSPKQCPPAEAIEEYEGINNAPPQQQQEKEQKTPSPAAKQPSALNPDAKPFTPRAVPTTTPATPPLAHTPQIVAQPHLGPGPPAPHMGFHQGLLPTYVMATQQPVPLATPSRYPKRAIPMAGGPQRAEFTSPLQVANATGQPLQLTPAAQLGTIPANAVQLPQSMITAQQPNYPYQMLMRPVPSMIPMSAPTSMGIYPQNEMGQVNQISHQMFMPGAIPSHPPNQVPPGNPSQPPTPQSHNAGPQMPPGQPPPTPSPSQQNVYAAGPASIGGQPTIPQHYPHSHPHAQSPHASPFGPPNHTGHVVVFPHGMLPQQQTMPSSAGFTSTANPVMQHFTPQNAHINYIQGNHTNPPHHLPLVHHTNQ